MRGLVITADRHLYTMSADARPVGRVSSGEIVAFECLDALGGQIRSEEDTVADIDFSRVNPATGPVYVEGAEPGDTLAVDILAIDTASTGVVLSVPNLGILGDRVQTPRTSIARIGPRWVELEGIRLPKAPMIGVIGVAPRGGAVPCGTPGPHGGNMDTREIRVGSTLYLPVSQPGALLALGDVHAVMGDGEVCGTGVECAAKVTVRVRVVRDWPVEWPWLETEDDLMVIASAADLDAAAREATSQLVEFLHRRCGYSFDTAYMLVSTVGDLRISQVVDPLLTVRASIPRTYVEGEQ